jgi:hypothetical protein
MPITEAPHVTITALGRVSATTLLFRASGQLRVAVVVKATFLLAQDGPMILVDPAPIVRGDQHQGGDPDRSLCAASDLVPYRPLADVLLAGHARAPIEGSTARLGLRLMVARGQDLLLDKRLAAQGPPDARGEPTPIASVPLEYERAARSADNPVGAQVERGAWPEILDRWHRAAPVGFGPIAAHWPARRGLLPDPEVLRAPIPSLPADFPWDYFNAAPPDQRIEFLRGDEWIGFEGMNSQIPRVQSHLPRALGLAKLYGPAPGLQPGRAIALVADTLSVDADQLRASVVWRGSFAVSSEGSLADLRVFAGVETAFDPLAFPASYEEALALACAPASAAAEAPVSTVDMSMGAFERAREAPTMPFEPHDPLPPRDPSSRWLPPATPFDRLELWGSKPSPTPIPPPGTAEIAPDLVALARAARMPFAPSIPPPPPPDLLAAPLPPATPFARAVEAPSEAAAEIDAIRAPADDGGEADAQTSKPKTLGEHFLATLASAEERGSLRRARSPRDFTARARSS